MSYYFKKTPFFIRWIYPKAIWRKNVSNKVLYLTFDDGPINGVTDWVLNQLKQYNAKATFFCIGENADKNAKLLNQITDDGHSIGNHMYYHIRGTENSNNHYYENIEKANKILNTKLFRPPYGKMKLSQYRKLKNDYHIIMWDVMAGDFDTSIDGERCYRNVINNSSKGSIIVFHDTEKAFPRLEVALPRVLKYYTDLGYKFELLTNTY